MEPLAWRFGILLIYFFMPALRELFFGSEADGRIPIIQKGVQETVGLIKGIKGVLALKTPISDGFPHHIAVFLFNETIVIFPVWASAGELDIALDAPVKEPAVNELAAIVAVDA